MLSRASGFPTYAALYAVIDRACRDAVYLDRLVHNPEPALAEAGVTVPVDADIRIHQPRPGRLLLTLPPMLAGDRGHPDILPDDPALRPMAEAMLRAAREPAFREDLRVAPVATLRSRGVVLAPGMMVDVIDAEPGRIDIIIPDLAAAPDAADLADDMLEDDDLDGVSGGAPPRAGAPSVGSGAGAPSGFARRIGVGGAACASGDRGMIGASTLLTMGGMVAFGIQHHGRAG